MIHTLTANVPLMGHLYLQHHSPTGASHIFYFQKSSTLVVFESSTALHLKVVIGAFLTTTRTPLSLIDVLN